MWPSFNSAATFCSVSRLACRSLPCTSWSQRNGKRRQHLNPSKKSTLSTARNMMQEKKHINSEFLSTIFWIWKRLEKPWLNHEVRGAYRKLCKWPSQSLTHMTPRVQMYPNVLNNCGLDIVCILWQASAIATSGRNPARGSGLWEARRRHLAIKNGCHLPTPRQAERSCSQPICANVNMSCVF